MPNAWIAHVKEFASNNKMSYGCALSDERVRASYKNPEKKVVDKVVKSKRTAPDDFEWSFKVKKPIPSYINYINALSEDQLLPTEGLYKDSEANPFSAGDFKRAIDGQKRPATSNLLRIAKLLQKEELGKVVRHKKK